MKAPFFLLSKLWFISIFILYLITSDLLAQDSTGFGYAENAISINESGEILEGQSTIYERNEDLGMEGRAYKPTFGVVANRDSSYYYETGRFYSGGKIFGYVQVLTISGQEKKVELEFYAEFAEASPALVEVDRRREEWIQLCNAHNAAVLINELYADNTMYYNHKPMVIGRPGLIQDYQYMNRESYSLHLSPLKTDQITDQLVLEIGQCSGSYNGKYIIVWKRNAQGKWEVFLDSNI